MGTGGVLVRPDGHVAWRTAGDPGAYGSVRRRRTV
ncbi:aromatic-ring hydroxylase C-terminal domain-containing protein [Catenuloplanes japonicus]